MSASAETELHFRPTLASDKPFCQYLFNLVRIDEMQAGDWDPAVLRPLLDLQFAAHQQQLPHADGLDDRLLLAGAEAIGRLVLHRRPDAIHVADLSLLPAFRRRGIGTQVLTQLQAEARGRGQALRLQCLLTNPALALYQRLGFRTAGVAHGAHLALAWDGAPGA